MRMFLIVVPVGDPTKVVVTDASGDMLPQFGQEMEISKDDLRLDLDHFLPRFMAPAVAVLKNMAEAKGII